MADEIAMMEKLELEALVASQAEEQDQQFEPELPQLPSLHQQPQQLMHVQWGNGAGHQSQQQGIGSTSVGSVYGSDDDEYDSIFQDVFEEEIKLSQSQSQQQQVDGQDQDMMDMS